MAAGGLKGGSQSNSDQQAQEQAIAQGIQGMMANYSKLGLGPADPSAVFPSGTPFGGDISGFPPGTAPGTMSTPEQTDIGNIATMGTAAFAPLTEASAQQNAQASGLLAGSGLNTGGIGNIGGGLPNLGTG